MNDTSLNKIAIPSPVVAAHRVAWEVVDALMGGTTTMRSAGEKFLPIEPNEERVDWEARLKRTTLDPYYKEGVTHTVSKVFAHELQFSDVPKELEVMLEDIDQQQRNATQFGADVFTEAVNLGVSYLLVDYPSVKQPFDNRAQELAAGLRPYWVRISPLNLLDIRSSSFNGAERLSLFRYLEHVGADNGSDDQIEQIREYRQTALDSGQPGPVEYTLYRKGTNTNWAIHSQGLITQDAIPVAVNYTNRTQFGLGSPPLLDLAELNIEHWRKRSDLNNILHICNVPFLLAKGFDTVMDPHTGRPAEALEINIRKAIITSKPDASIEWVMHSGSTIAVAMQDLERLEARMQALASTLVTGRSGNPTATATAINAAEANAELKQMALSLQDACNAALYFTAYYLGLPVYGRIDVNTSFSVEFVSDSTFAQVLELFSLGVIDRDVLISESKRRNILDLNVKIAPPTKAQVTSLDGQVEVMPE
jgi:hypothetical protein